MRLQLDFKSLRKYCGSCDRRKGNYIITIDPEYYMPENIDTFYHEMTHLLSLLIKNGKIGKENKKIKKYILTDDDEEQLCQAVAKSATEHWITMIKK